jgi:hypothetical protein
LKILFTTTTPVIVAGGKRSFSKLKIIETFKIEVVTGKTE